MAFLIFLHSLWHFILGFVFYYPLFMSSLWIIGAIFFYFKNERPYAKDIIPPLNPHERWPGVSILIPCYNEGENAVETISYALNVHYPEFEVIAINDGSKDN
ncbi:MAG: glycosyltransferase family 2 protein, partial [Sulfuricurvum sp.]